MTSRDLVIFFLSLFATMNVVYAQNAPDCEDAIEVCSDEDIEDTPTGPGDNDFADPDNSDGCLSGENYSTWFYIEINADADPDLELGFIIDPEGSDDYDFAVFGPDVDCGDLGSPIRCSWAAGNSDTGLSASASDVSEGAGGDGFVSTITVQPGQGFYILIDNFSETDDGYNLSWTGSGATALNCFDDPPPDCDEVLNLTAMYEQCASDGPIILDLTVTGDDTPYSFNWMSAGGGLDYMNDPSLQNPTLIFPDDLEAVFVYIVEVTGASGNCTSYDTTEVTIHPSPSVNIEPVPELCELDDNYVLSASPPGGIWGGVADENGGIDIADLGAGTFDASYTYVSDFGCEDSAVVSVTIVSAPDIVIEAIDTLCETGDPVVLDASPPGGVWSAPVEGSVLDPGDLGLESNWLYYTATAGQNCSSTDSLEVYVTAEVVSQIIGPTEICQTDGGVQYEGLPANGNWSGIVDESGYLDPSNFDIGVYQISYLAPPMDCSQEAFLTIEIQAAPYAVVENEITICNTGQTEIDFDTLVLDGDMDGIWEDTDGSGASGDFPLLDFSNVSPGVYTFSYTTNSAPSACAEQSYVTTIVVEDCACPSVQLEEPNAYCQDEIVIVLDDFKVTTEPGWWEIVSTPPGSNPLELMAGVLAGFNVDPGQYILRFNLDNPETNCPDSAEIEIIVTEQVLLELQDTLYACNAASSGSYPSVLNLYDAVLIDNQSGAWTDLGNSGASGPYDALNFNGVDAGLYVFGFESYASQAPCPNELGYLTVRVIDCECPEITFGNQMGPFCNSQVDYDLSTYVDSEIEGIWTIESQPQGDEPLQIEENRLVGETVDPGVYGLSYTLIGTVPDGCDSTWSFMVEVLEQPEILLPDTIYVCNTDEAGEWPNALDLNSVVSDNGNSGEWSDVDQSGAAVDSSFYLFSGIDTGFYRFSYSTTWASQPCMDVEETMVIAVVNCICPSLGVEDSLRVCGDLINEDLSALRNEDLEGDWTVIAGPSTGELEIIGDSLRGSDVLSGRYELLFTVSEPLPQGCDSTAILVIEVVSPPQFELSPNAQICNSSESGQLTIVNLQDYLVGDSLGLWSELDSMDAFTDLPEIDFEGFPVGTYRFEYEVLGEAGCDDRIDTIEVRVIDCSCPSLPIEFPMPICQGDSIDLCGLQSTDIDGYWVLSDAPDGLNIEDDCFVVSDRSVESGSYEIIFYSLEEIPEACADSVIGELEILDRPFAGEHEKDTLFCQDELETFNLFHLLDGEDTGGVWITLSSEFPDDKLDEVNGILTVEGLTPGEYRFYYEFAGNCPDQSESVTVSIRPYPEAYAGEDEVLNCDMPVAVLGIEPQAGQSYFWIHQEQIISEDAMIEVRTEGLYILEVMSVDGCVSRDSVVVTNEGAIEAIAVMGINPLCYGEASGGLWVDEIVGGQEPYTLWVNGVEQDSLHLEHLPEGEYLVEIVDANGCRIEEIIVLDNPEPFTVELGPDLTVFQGDTVLLTASNTEVDSLTWSSSVGDYCSDCGEWQLRPLESMVVYATAFNAYGCSAMDTLNINVLINENTPNYYIPNIFTPNNDGLNDWWFVQGNESLDQVYNLEIYDRWGSQVFKSVHTSPGVPELGWNGLQKDSQKSPSGVYFYYAELLFENGLLLYVSGDLTLIR